MAGKRREADEGEFQTTAIGYRIPIPNRDDVERALRKLAAPAVPRPARKEPDAAVNESSANGNSANGSSAG